MILVGEEAFTGLKAEKLTSLVEVGTELKDVSATLVAILDSGCEGTTLVKALDVWLGIPTPEDSDDDRTVAMMGDTVATGGEVTDLGRIGEGITIC